MNFDYVITQNIDYIDMRNIWGIECTDTKLHRAIMLRLKDSILSEIDTVKITNGCGILIESSDDIDYSWFIEKIVDKTIKSIKILEECFNVKCSDNIPELERII